jgi:transmembrane sensor
MQNNERIVQLLYRRLKGLTLTVEEDQEVDAWLARSESNRKILDNLSDEEWLKAARKRYYAPGKEAGLTQLREQLFAELPAAKPFQWRRLAVAASVLFILAYAIYLMVPTKQVPGQQYAATLMKHQYEITPGGEAILTLSNGLKIPLRERANGLLAQLGDGKQLLKQDGKLVYQYAVAQETAGEVQHATYPRSDQYVTLPDGSRVWLNRDSKMTYEEDFSSNTRMVELHGEGYFEIATAMAANGVDRKPFIVKVLSKNGNTETPQVEVLGTRFNVHAYEGEPIRTTLADGSVRMTLGAEARIMKPGQQVIIDIAGQHIAMKEDVYVEGALAWTNDEFRFKDESIETILKELRRVYNIPYAVMPAAIDSRFSLISDHNKPLPQVLNELKAISGKANVTFDGKLIIVAP